MKLSKLFKTALLAVVGTALAASAAKAQNPNNATGDLILGFQNPGGTTGSDQTVLVSLGLASTIFRDASGNITNIINIGSILTSTFGSNWWEQTTLYMGALSAWSSSSLSTSLSNGDPTRTTYVSAGRTALGTAGSANSVGWSGIGASSLGTASTRMLAIASDLETSGTGAALAVPTSTSDFDDNNPFLAGSQDTSYATFAGGTEYQFGVGAFGTLSGYTAEAAIDLYRLQARSDISGQYGFGGTNGTGEYQGSLVIDQSGNVSFINAVVPEPSTAAFVGMAGLFSMMARRRRA